MSTNISWTDETWNPVTGCSKVSPGCAHCYAETLSKDTKMARFGYTGLDWTPANAALNVKLRPDRLEKPLHWTKPRMVFVNSMSDLFHELVPDEFIRSVFKVMAASPKHTFQVLTKRPERMMAFMNALGAEAAFADIHGTVVRSLPLRNVWLGTSVENQHWADIRIPLLLKTPAAVRFLSCEPLLGPVYIEPYLWLQGTSTAGPWRNWEGKIVGRGGGMGGQALSALPSRDLHWIIVGGESGPGFRTMDLDWARQLRDQCLDASVPFFFKQRSAYRSEQGKELDGQRWEQMPAAASIGGRV